MPALSYGNPAEATLASARPSGSGAGTITLNFADTDVRDVVQQILGEILRVTYTIDPAVRGNLTLRSATPLSREQLLPLLSTLLTQVGASLQQGDGIYRIVPGGAAVTAAAPPAAGAPGATGAPVLAESGAVAGSSLVPLRFVSAPDLVRELQPFVGTGARLVAATGSNAIIVSGEPATRSTLTALIQAFDINQLAGQSYALMPVNGGSARELAQSLTAALRGRGNSLNDLARVVPMDRVDAVLVIAGQPRFIDEARRVYALITQARRSTVRAWHVYHLRNSRANDVAYILQQAFTPLDVTAPPPSNDRTQPGAGQQSRLTSVAGGNGIRQGAMQQAGVNSPLATGVAGGAGNPLLDGNRGAAGNTNPLAPNNSALAGGGGQPNPLLGGIDMSSGNSAPDPNAMRIIANAQNNALLVYQTEQERDTFEQMLRKIDIIPLQVRIDATIAEVQLNNQLQYGTQFFFKSGGINGILSNSTQTIGGGGALANLASAALSSSFPGFVIGGSSAGGAPLAIAALQQVTKVNVLSSPQLLVLDSQTAKLQVGNLVPYQNLTSQSTVGNSPIINSIAYQPTGVTMEVTPRVNSGGLVTLDISQGVSDVVSLNAVAGTTGASISSPTFADRSVSSRIVVQDGQTVGLAGLIRDNDSRNNDGIPWLKDIPIIGALAGSQSNQRQRTELLILITPHVMHDQREARELTEDLRATLSGAAGLPYLAAEPPLGAKADPGRQVRRRLGLAE